MKKFLPIMFLIIALLTAGTTAFCEEQNPQPKARLSIEHHQKMKSDFEKRLNLTEKQKEKAKKIHEKGAKQMKKIMDESVALRKEMKTIYKSDIEDKLKEEKVKKIKEKLRNLDKKAHEIRKENGKEFEKILTPEQKKELEKMKAEGRANFAKHHPDRPPFRMFSGQKPLFPPPRPLPVKEDK